MLKVFVIATFESVAGLALADLSSWHGNDRETRATHVITLAEVREGFDDWRDSRSVEWVVRTPPARRRQPLIKCCGAA